MKRLLFPLVLAAMLTTACNSTHLTVRVWHGGKVERTVCKGYESKPYERASDLGGSGYFLSSSASSDGNGAWTLTRCTEHVTLDPQTIVGYVGSSNNLYKCRVSQEFYEVVAEGQAYTIPIGQCRLVPPDLPHGEVQMP